MSHSQNESSNGTSKNFESVIKYVKPSFSLLTIIAKSSSKSSEEEYSLGEGGLEIPLVKTMVEPRRLVKFLQWMFL